MSSIALHEYFEGHEVYGSNLEETERTSYLRKFGIKVFVPHSRGNWLDPDLVVKSSAVPINNPEVELAKEKNVEVMDRLVFFREILNHQKKPQFAVTGTDGKTTTTAMLAHVFKNLSLSPTVFLGGISVHFEHGNYERGTGPFVYELDESNEEFGFFTPDFLIVTNARGDHLENYQNSLDHYKSAFERICKNAEVTVTYAEDENIARFGTVTFGVRRGDYTLQMRTADRFKQRVIVEKKGKRLLEFCLNVPGFHNVLNALAVIALMDTLGYDLSVVVSALETYRNVYRRFTISFEDAENGLYVIDDYAHTSDEVRSLLETTKEVFYKEKIVVVFQPHRYSRLEREDGKLADALALADEIVVTEVYDAYEEKKEKVSGRMILDFLAKGGKKAVFVENLSDLKEVLRPDRNTVFLFVGAGDIVKASKEFIRELQSSKMAPSPLSGSNR